MAFVLTSGTSPGATSTTIVITAPTSIAVGDYLTAHLFYAKSGGTPTVTPPSGFASLKIENGDTNELQVFGKVADSGDAAAGTFTFTLSSSQVNLGYMLRIRGQKTSGAFDTSNSSFSGSNSTTITVPTITPTNPGSLFIFYGGRLGGGGGATSGYAMVTDNPSVWTEHYDGNFLATSVRLGSAATGDITATQTNAEHYQAIVIVINVEPVNVTVSPSVISFTGSVQAPTISTGTTVSPSVITMTSAIQAPTVTTEAAKWTNQSKSSTPTWTNQNKS